MAKKTTKARIRGSKNGHCNICGNYGELTIDHIPPRGSTKIGTVEITTLSEHFSSEKIYFLPSQKGLLFRSICSVCNSHHLGKLYDPQLNKISYEVKSLVKSHNERKLIWPGKIKISIAPQRVARAIVGHLLAGSLSNDKNNTPVNAPMPNGLRDYFLHSTTNSPDELEIYYWLYFSNIQKIIKNIGVAVPGKQGLIFGDILKFFPVAYWVVWDQPDDLKVNFPKLIRRKTMGVDETDYMEIDFQNIPRVDWPENPDDNMIILYRDDSAIVANPKL